MTFKERVKEKFGEWKKKVFPPRQELSPVVMPLQKVQQVPQPQALPEPKYLDRESIKGISKIAESYGMTPSEMLASLYAESTFNTNPSINEENSATALGPLQITRNFTEKNAQGLPAAYPGYPELYIEPEDRRDLMKSAEFRAKHFKRFNDLYKDRDLAIGQYYGLIGNHGTNYAKKIRELEKSKEVQDLLQYIK